MTTIQTIPVYNRKGKRLTSIEINDYNTIKHEDEDFFDVQPNFVIIRDRFFRPPHLVKEWTFWIQGDEVSADPIDGNEYKNVLFVLESPNRNEFDYANEFKAGRPLSRNSFINFKNNFHRLMNRIDKEPNARYEVTFYNMVPFQTSLYYLLKKGTHKMTRYNFWLTGWWGLRYNREFKTFMEKNRFDFCFNASKRMFKDIISKELSKFVQKEYQVHHPDSNYWRRKELNLGVKQIIHKEEVLDFD